MRIKSLTIKTVDSWDDVKSPYKGSVSFDSAESVPDHRLSCQTIAAIFDLIRIDIEQHTKAADAMVANSIILTEGEERDIPF
jgi:hypothetical protein